MPTPPQLQLAHESSDPQQHLVEVLGLSTVLKERRRFIAAGSTINSASVRELEKIQAGLMPSAERLTLLDPLLIHSTPAARRLVFQFRNGKSMLTADLAMLQAMREFPENLGELSLVRRLTYLRALQILDLLPERAIQEFVLLRSLLGRTG